MIKKRFLSFVVSSCMLFGSAALLPEGTFSFGSSITASAEDEMSGQCGENVYWELDDEGVLTISGKGEMYDYSPDSSPFSGRYDIYSVKISEEISNIGNCEFYCCFNLKNVSLPDSLRKIGDSAFNDCENLASAQIPSGVTYIGDGAYYKCEDLKNIYIPDGVKRIGKMCFYIDRSLEIVNIPNSVEIIGDNAFDGCVNLSKVNIPTNISFIGQFAFRNTIWLKNQQLKNPLVVINGALIDGSNCEGIINIPSNVNCIAEYAFYRSAGLKKVVIPSSIKTIEEHTFDECTNLSEVTIHNGVKRIEDSAFSHCDKLNNVYLPSTLNFIGEWTFFGCSSLSRVTIPHGVTNIGDYSFCNCKKITSINIPSTVKNIGESTFSGCTNLKYLTIPSSINRIEDAAFSDCDSLAEIYYSGTKNQWDNISISNYNNGNLFSANIHFNSAYEGESVSTLSATDLNCISGKKASITGSFTPSKKENLDNEIAAIKVSCDSDKLVFGSIQHLNSSDNSSATISVDVTAKSYGDYSVLFSLPDSNTSEEVIVHAEPELILPGSSAGNAYNHYANLTVDCNGEGDIVTKNITFNVSIDEADKQYLESFLKSIEVSTLETSDLTTHAEFDSSYSIAEDGKSASFVVSVFCGRFNIDDYISVKTLAQESIIRVTRDISNTFSNQIITIDSVWGFNNYSEALSQPYFDKFYMPGVSALIYNSMFDGKGNPPGMGGLCGGMVTSAIAASIHNAPYPSTFKINGEKYASCLHDIKEKNICSLMYSADDLVKYAWVYQTTPLSAVESKSNKNDLGKLYSSIEDSIYNKGEIVEIGVQGDFWGTKGRHSLMVMGIGNDNSEVTEIIVYDCNLPDTPQILNLYKSSGKYTSWGYSPQYKYPVNLGSNKKWAEITFTTSGNDFARDMFSSTDKALIQAQYQLLSINNDDISISISNKKSRIQDCKDTYKISTCDVSNATGNNTNAQYWVKKQDSDIVFHSVSADNEIAIADSYKTVTVNSPNNSDVKMLVSNDESDYVRFENVQNKSDFSICICTYDNNLDNTSVKETAQITGVVSKSASISNNTNSIEITGTDSFKIKTTNSNTKADEKTIVSNGHSVKITRSNDSSLKYTIDINDDGKYDNKDIGTERLAGSNRFITAVEISKACFNKANTVILAYGMNYADALAGVPFATKLSSPILLTDKNTLPKETLAEINRLGAKKVIILGGTGAISDTVEKLLKDNKLETERLAGSTRFGTASAIGEKLNEKPTDVFFVYYNGFADALAVSTVAALKSAPIIYLSTSGTLNADTADYLERLKKAGSVKNAYIIGGTGVISDDMASKAAKALGLKKAIRVAGTDRFKTCVAVNNQFKDILNSDMMCIATGMDFPDALAGGVFAAINRAPLFLINGKLKTPKLSDEQKAYLKSKSAGVITIFGGKGAVPDNHINDIVKNSI